MSMKKLLLILTCLLLTLSIQAQWTRRTNLPTLYIYTFNGKQITSKTEYVYASLVYVDEEDNVLEWDSIQIRGRGNSTWNMNKKPYRIKFLNKFRLLGKDRANAKSWTLLANAADKTLIRNAVTSAMGEFTALPFNPAYKFVDLVMNGSYLGNYQISDQIDIRRKRVDIVEQDVPLPDDADISGGYLLEVDGFKDGNCFTTSIYSVPIRIHSPDEDEIVQKQNLYIRDYISMFERKLADDKFADKQDGYRSMIDSTTLIDWYICTEVSANIDGFYSTYFYKDQNDPLLYWGPLWDYDIAYDNDSRKPGTVNQLMVNYGFGATKNWINRMWQDEWFQKKVYHRYKELLDRGLVEHMMATIDSLTTLMEQSRTLNYQKWGINTKVYNENVLYSTYDEYVRDLKNFITNHTQYLLNAFADRKPDEPTPPFIPMEYFYRITNVNTNKAIDISGTSVVQYDNQQDRESEDWWVKPAQGHYMIINRSNLMALNDPTVGETTPTTNLGTQLNVALQDSTDEAQLWDFLPQGTQGYYNLLNVKTQHIANLSGGNSANGTHIISYSNDNRNGESKNRLWYITSTHEQLPEELTGIAPITDLDYILAYNSDTHLLRFATENPEQLTFTATLYNAKGQLITRFKGNETFDMSILPNGIYVVTWNFDGKRKSVKFKK